MANKDLTRKDVCLVIPTYNRSEDVDRTLSVIIKNKNIPGKIIIIDQSKDDKTKKVVLKHKKNIPVEYVYSSVPSSSIAENIGVKKAKSKFKLILISGDDMDFLSGYMDSLVKEFNEHPELMGLGGMDTQAGAARHSTSSKIASIILKLFFLPFSEDNKFRVRGPYGTTASPVIKTDIRDAEWIPGFNNCFRISVYENYSFPESLGYNVLEDIDCSYKVYKKYGHGSLLITSKCRVWHRESPAARYPPRKRIFVNHEDHFAFYYRNFCNFSGSLKMIFSISGIILGNALRFLAKPKKETYALFKNNLDAILFCYKNRQNIKDGKYRLFLNPDLSLKKELE